VIAQGLKEKLTIAVEDRLLRRGQPLLFESGKRGFAPFLSFMEEKMKKLTLYAMFILFLSSSLMADSFSLSFFQNMTNNLFQNSYAEPDQVSTLNFYVDKNFSQVSIFTQGNYAYLFENPNLTYYVHDLGLDYLHPINQKTALYFSLAGRGAFWRSDYSDFNYFSVNFFSALKTYLSQTSILKANYSLEYKDYKYSIFDFLSNSIHASMDKYFQTKTTLRAEMNWGYKYFLHPFLSQEVILVDENQYFLGGNGKGKGKSSGARQYQYVMSTKGEGKGIQAFSLTGLIAQGLGNKVGLRLSGMKQWTLSGNNPFTFIEEFYAVENPSYDRFSWAGYELGTLLTVLMPWNIQLKMGYTMTNKEFPGIESLSLEGDSLGIIRKDERKRFEVEAEKNFSKFSLFFSYFYVDNNSNDPFFEWKGHFFSAGIEWNISLGERR